MRYIVEVIAGLLVAGIAWVIWFTIKLVKQARNHDTGTNRCGIGAQAMTPERIAEIEAWVTGAVPTHSDALSQDDILHLCRLARLGLRVESAPTGTCEELGDSDLVKDQYRWKGLAAVVFPDNDDPESGPVMEVGKRVALVLLEESK